MVDLGAEWNELNLNGQLEGLALSLEKDGVLAQSTLDALGKSVGLTGEEVKTKL
jgi:hypothetical protein